MVSIILISELEIKHKMEVFGQFLRPYLCKDDGGWVWKMVGGGEDWGTSFLHL